LLGSNIDSVNTATLLLNNDNFDMYTAVQNVGVVADNTNGAGKISLTNNFFNMNGAVTYSSPIVQVTGTTARANIQNNTFSDISSGSGTAISVGTDNWNVVMGNSAPAWSMSFPTATFGIYTCNNYATSTTTCGTGSGGSVVAGANINITGGNTINVNTALTGITGISGFTGNFLTDNSSNVLAGTSGGALFIGNSSHPVTLNSNSQGFIPANDATANVGGSGNRFNTGFFVNEVVSSSLTVGGASVLTSIGAGTNISVSGNTVSTVSIPTFTSVLASVYENTSGNTLLSSSGASAYLGSSGNTVFSNANFLPNSDASTTNGYLGFSGNRWYQVWASNGTIQTSDARLKEDIHAEPLGLGFIRSLRPVSYKGTDDSGFSPGVHHGLIAQEVETALHGQSFAGLEVPKTDNDRYGLNYAEFVAPLIRSAQELDDKVNIAYLFIGLLVVWNLRLTVRVRRLEKKDQA